MPDLTNALAMLDRLPRRSSSRVDDIIARALADAPPRSTAIDRALGDPRGGGGPDGSVDDQQGGGSAPGLNGANTDAPSFTLASQTQGPLDAAIQGMNAANVKGNINNALNITSPIGRTLSNAVMSHAPVISGPLNMAQQMGNILGAIRGIAAYMGVDDDSPTFDDVAATAMNMNSPITATAMQGLIGNSFDAGRLNSQNQRAPFNNPQRAPTPDPDPEGLDAATLSNIDAANAANAANAPAPGTPGGAGGGPAGGGTGAGGGTAAGNSGDASDAEDRGGLIGRKPRRAIDAKGHVMVKALPSEFIVRPSETKKLLPALKDLNRPGVSPLERRVREFEAKHGDRRI